MKHLPPYELSPRELFEFQRKLMRSHDLLERLSTLWIGALLGERLERCSDRQIGDLLSMMQDGLGIFSPEFVVCEHAKRRLLRSSFKPRKENWQAVRDAGVELLNAEAALFRAGIPHMLLPFQRDGSPATCFMCRAHDGRENAFCGKGFGVFCTRTQRYSTLRRIERCGSLK